MSLMKDKDAALARAADDKKLTAAARAERDAAASRQQAVAAQFAALQVQPTPALAGCCVFQTCVSVNIIEVLLSSLQSPDDSCAERTRPAVT
jgi:hypothetical protein